MGRKMQESKVSNKMSAVCAAIRSPFADTIYPGHDNIGCSNWEGYELGLHLKGKRWQDLTVKDVDFMSHAVTMMTPEAYRYYLPAYLILGLTEILSANRYVDESLLPPENEETWLSADFKKRVEPLTADQKRAICLYLSLEAELIDAMLQDYNDNFGDDNFGEDNSEQNKARNALERYWSKFLNEPVH